MTEKFQEQHDTTMDSLLRALETAPDVTVPADFAARVMARVPQSTRSSRRLRCARALTPHYGRAAVFCALGILLCGMLAMSRVTGGSSMWMALQLLLLAQLCGYAVWFGLASWRRG